MNSGHKEAFRGNATIRMPPHACPGRPDTPEHHTTTPTTSGPDRPTRAAEERRDGGRNDGERKNGRRVDELREEAFNERTDKKETGTESEYETQVNMKGKQRLSTHLAGRPVH